MDTQARLAAIWQRYRESTIRRFELLDFVRMELEAGRLNANLRHKAAGEAHTLVGSLGTFGLQRGARIARELQLLLGGEAELALTDATRVGDLLDELRSILDEPLPKLLVASGESTFAGKRLLIVDDDVDATQQLATHALRRGFEVNSAESVEQAQAALASGAPDVIVLELLLPTRDEGVDFLRRTVAQYPDVTVIVVTRSYDFMDRVAVARWGGRGFLEKPLSPNDVLDFAFEVLRQRQRQHGRILLVDDDEGALRALAALLERDGYEAHKIHDPAQFWRALEMVSPDLVVLDVHIPEINGLELCRTMRNDARWATLPVLFLTTETDQLMLLRGFDLGVDDFVKKDASPEEIRARIGVRLERAAAQSLHMRRDPLTGLLNRREATTESSRLLSLAARHGNFLSITLLDLDHFKSINDRFGHAAGDEVLRRMAGKMQSFFRNEDVIARWGGEEFLVATYGMDAPLAAQRVRLLLEQFRQETFDFAGPDFRVTFSAGIADFPLEKTLEAAVARADGALYDAKAEGRNRVVAAGLAKTAETAR